MSAWRHARLGLRGLLNRRGRQQEVLAELEYFYEAAEAERIAEGMTPREARLAVRGQQGSMAKAREHMGAYGWENRLHLLLDDLRFAMRQLFRRPAFAIAAVLTLAIGIGANVAIFTVVERVLIAPLPYRHAERIVAIETHFDTSGRTTHRVTGPDAVDARDNTAALEAVSLYSGGKVAVQINNQTAYAPFAQVDSNFQRVFSLVPIAGRLFHPDDAKHAVLVSQSFAEQHFGSALQAVGKVLRVEGAPAEIVGVVAAFDFPDHTEVWLASPSMPESQVRSAFNYHAVGLLRPDVHIDVAQAQLNVLSSRLQQQFPKDNHGKVLRLEPLKEALTGDSRPTLLLLMAATGVILLIACVNVTHLEIVRSLEQHRELAVRIALGAPRWRVMRPVLLEGALIAGGGAVLGVLLALPVLRVLVAMAPSELLRTADIHVDVATLAFCAAVGTLTALLSTLLPAWRAAQADPIEALKSDTTRGLTRQGTGRFRFWLVVAEITATFVLAAGAGLLLRTVLSLNARDMGFDPEKVLVVDADVPAQTEQDGRRAAQTFSVIFDHLRQLPGVVGVGGIMGLPTGDYGSNGQYQVQGGLPVDPARPLQADFSVISPAYFQTMRIPLVAGRDFGMADTGDGLPVVVLSAAAAKQTFGAADPLGHQIRCGLDSDRWMTVVGVVGNVRQDTAAAEPGPTLYMPMSQHPAYANQIHMVIRTVPPPLAMAHAVDRTIAADGASVARSYTTLGTMVGQSTATQRFRSVLLALLAFVAMLLAILGVYGTVAYSVAQRRFEFGLRLAFGALPSYILRMVLRQALIMACVGIVSGLMLSVLLARTIAAMLTGVRPFDPLSLVGVAALLLITTVCAAWVPGRRAAGTSPMLALRME